MMRHGMKCYGSTVIGEKGQIVIPAEVRKKLNIKSGDKFLVLAHEKHAPILLIRADALARLVKRMFGGDIRELLEAAEIEEPARKAKGKKRR